MTPEAADSNYGVLGRGEEGKNGLNCRETFRNFDPFLQKVGKLTYRDGTHIEREELAQLLDTDFQVEIKG